MSDWPSPNDYTAAIQAPAVCFRDADLRRCSVEKHALTRMPKVWTGNFAQVYELTNGHTRWAVKCFTRSSADIRRRYACIADAIAHSQLPYFVEFRFQDEEILVNGRRYPVVKMEWVDGMPLDKYVETHLFQPQILLGLASSIVRMVVALESKGLAHGDLQHGNIFIRGGDVKLVDYDGMFVPAFQGERAPEAGLPSYQHPRRTGTTYDSRIDRFPLLVISTGLCALAVDPRLWYRFSTGDNVLFRKDDFESTARSQLFSELRGLGDRHVKELSEVLRKACEGNPEHVMLPDPGIALKVAPAAKPWWVSIQHGATIPKPAGRPRVGQVASGPLTLLRSHWSLGCSVTAGVGLLVLWSAGLLDARATSVLTLGTGLGYVLERYRSFRALPVFIKRSALTKRLTELRREQESTVEEQKRLQAETAEISQREVQERATALKTIREREMASALSRIDIARLARISGVGPHLIGSLKAAGIQNAADLDRGRWYGIRGFGPKRRSQITSQLREWKNEAERRASTSLPIDVDKQIATKYEQDRRIRLNQLATIGTKLVPIGNELQLLERELAQLSIPGFGHFLRHNV